MALEALKRNGHNLHIGEFETDGRYNIPVLKPILLEHRLHWLPFNCARTDKGRSAHGIHFFVDDYLFERVWNDPARYALLLSDFRAVMTPDFSLFTDYPLPVQIYTGVSEQLAADMETLDSLDAEIEALLKKRQNGYFSESDQIRLQELIDTREAIEIKYHLVPADVDGFDTIRQKLEAEVARAQARGKADADVTVYENAMVAAAEGLAAVNAQIDAQYDKEYALIQLIEDSAERQAAMDALNARYNEQRRTAAQEYAALLADIVLPVWEQENIRQAAADMDALNQKLREYSAASESEKPALLEDLNAITAAMDEGAMTEYIGMLTQIQSLLDQGMTKDEIQAMFPEIDFTTALEQIASIQEFLNNRELELPGLTEMFGGALPEEVLTIATDLDMTGAQERWDAFAADPGAITTDAIIAQLKEDENTQRVQPQVDAFIAKYDTKAKEDEDMSHFSVAVFSQTPGDVEALLAPFDEQVEAGSPYAEFVRNEEYDWDKAVGAKGYWRNPNARWDWWEIGGRWRGLLRLRPGKSGYTAPMDRWHSDFAYPPHCCDAALVADCDFSPREAQIRQAARMWEVVVDGDKPRENENFFNLWKPEYYLERYGDKETFIRRESTFSTYAFVTAEGEWHEQGRMGWFCMDDATNESIRQYEEEFQAYLQEARETGLAITIVDCHI